MVILKVDTKTYVLVPMFFKVAIFYDTHVLKFLS